MRNLLVLLILVITTTLFAYPKQAQATSIQIGVSVDKIPVSSGFNGTELVVFGSIEGVSLDALNRGEYSVVVKVKGGRQDVVIRQKERTLGIWINNEAEEFKNVPTFYSVLSDRPLTDIADTQVLSRAGLGIENLGSDLFAEEENKFILTDTEFGEALRRIRKDDGLFIENPEGLTKLSPSLFRATVVLPPNVPIGVHEVTAYLFRNGQQLTSKTGSYEIGKVGFERWIYNLAHEQGLLYGIMAVLLAIFTGWAANAIFRKN